MIECRGLVRSFGREGNGGDSQAAGPGAGKDNQVKLALDHIDFEVSRGETRCLLGPNGAGKTTLVRVLSTVLLPTAGTASVDGFDVVHQAEEVRRRVRLSLGGDRGFHQGLSVFENVRFWATMYGLGWREATRETRRVLDLVGMADEAKTSADGLSRGMKQRVHLARTLLGEADLLLLDEPTTGMDPVAAQSFRELIRTLQADGRTILLTTHNMVEAEELADRITMLNGGKVEVTDTAKQLRALYADRAVVAASDIPPELSKTIAKLAGVIGIRQERGETLIDVDGDTRPVLQALVEGGVTNLRAEPPSLEQVYVQLFGDRGLSV